MKLFFIFTLLALSSLQAIADDSNVSFSRCEYSISTNTNADGTPVNFEYNFGFKVEDSFAAGSQMTAVTDFKEKYSYQYEGEIKIDDSQKAIVRLGKEGQHIKLKATVIRQNGKKVEVVAKGESSSLFFARSNTDAQIALHVTNPFIETIKENMGLFDNISRAEGFPKNQMIFSGLSVYCNFKANKP